MIDKKIKTRYQKLKELCGKELLLAHKCLNLKGGRMDIGKYLKHIGTVDAYLVELALMIQNEEIKRKNK